MRETGCKFLFCVGFIVAAIGSFTPKYISIADHAYDVWDFKLYSFGAGISLVCLTTAIYILNNCYDKTINEQVTDSATE